MSSVPEFVSNIEDSLREVGAERQAAGRLGWTVQADHMYRIQDDQVDRQGARTGDVYRTTDDDASLEYIGTSFYLALDGEPLAVTDRRYGVWFDVIRGMPHVRIETDLQYWDPDPVYDAVEAILDDHDLPVVYDPADVRSADGNTAQQD